MAQARAWMRSGRKIVLTYRDQSDRLSERVIWPLVIGYHDASRLLIGWCELRQDFRHFRLDRVEGAVFLDERFPGRPAALRDRWLKQIRSSR